MVTIPPVASVFNTDLAFSLTSCMADLQKGRSWQYKTFMQGVNTYFVNRGMPGMLESTVFTELIKTADPQIYCQLLFIYRKEMLFQN